MDRASDIYEKAARHLTVMERLRLAAFILNGVAMPRADDLNAPHEESDLEASDLAQFLMDHAGVPLGDDKNRQSK
jgi:hypothetical protein